MNRFSTLLKTAVGIAGALAAGNLQAQSGPETPASAIRLNAGGAAYTDSLGRNWEEDQYYNTGRQSNSSNAIASTEDDALYQQRRWDVPSNPELQYAIAVPNGKHTVKLHFTETWRGAFRAGARVFDVRIEDQLVLDDLDIYREVGENTALVKSLPAIVTDGELNIEFIHKVENPVVAGIEVLLDLPTAPSDLAGTAVDSQQIVLNWDEAPDNEVSSLAGYRVYRDGVEIATTTDDTYSDTGLSPATSYRYAVATYNQFGYVSELSPSIAVKTLSADLPAIRLNAGGRAYTDSLGRRWAEDQYYNTGRESNSSNAIGGTGDDALYQQQRWDGGSNPELQYAIALPSGGYTVKLHFAEAWRGAFRVGGRVFDVRIEDQLMLDDLDIYREVGENAALVKSLPVTVTDGELNIQFLHQVQNPTVSAIEIIPGSNGGEPPPIEPPPIEPPPVCPPDCPPVDPPVDPPRGDAKPIARSDSVSTNEGTAVTIDVLANDKGLDDAPLTLTIAEPPSNGRANVRANEIRYTPDADHFGRDSVVYKITDADGDEAMGTVTIQIDCPSCAQDVEMTLSWNASNGSIVGYDVYRGPSSNTVNQRVSSLSVSRDLLDRNAPAVEYNATNDLGLRRGESICFKVKARSDQGVSEYSEAVCAVI